MSSYRVALVVCLSVGTLPTAAFVAPADRPKAHLQFEPTAVDPAPRALDPNGTAPGAGAARTFLARHGGQWWFRADERFERPFLVHGSGIPLFPGRGNTLGPEALSGLDLPDGPLEPTSYEPLVRAFIASQGSLLVPDRGELVFDRRSSQARDGGRLISFYYDWHVDGVPVEGARVFVRVNSGNVTQLGAPLVGGIAIDTRPQLGADGAIARLLVYTGDSETARLTGAPRLVIQSEAAPSGGIAHRLVWVVSYTVAGRIETWEGRIDAATGGVVGFRDLNRYARAVAGVFPRTVYYGNETVVPLPSLRVATTSGDVVSDVSGNFSYGGGEVTSTLGGAWFDTNCSGCSNPPSPSVSASIGIGRLDFGTGGADEVGNGFSSAADRNAFYHLNQVRRLGLKWLPGNPFMNEPLFRANVNINNMCNAVFTGNAVNFYRSGGGCNNTGEIADVMHHEYGHGIDLDTQGGDGATGEATADIVAIHMTHHPWIGPGFHTDGDPVRDLDANTSPSGFLTTSNVTSVCSTTCDCSFGPLGAEIHCEGEIYGQAAWELAQALAGKHGHHTGWRTSERVFFTSLPDADGYLPSSALPVYDAYLAADDDDGNLANGTPNAAEIFAALDAHGIAGAALPTSPQCSRPVQPTLEVTPACDSFVLDWNDVTGAVQYVVMRSELLQDTAYYPVAQLASGQTAWEDAEVAPDHDYWYAVMAVNASGCESTVESPIRARLDPRPVLSVTAATTDDEPAGNNSGFPDPGEQIDLALTLANIGALASTAISAELVPVTPGVTMVDELSQWPDLAPGAAAPNADVLSFTSDGEELACGDVMIFQLVPLDASVCAGEASYFDVRLGELVVEHADDFESDLGWQHDGAGSTADSGDWVLGDPVGTSYQPGSDVTPGLGTDCWYTATNPSGSNGTNDVDNGAVVLLSPLFDLASLESADVSYWRWFALSEPGEDAGDFFRAEVSPDGGQSWVTLENLSSSQPAASWVRQSFALEPIVPLTAQMRFRFTAADAPPEGNVVEAAIDGFRIERTICDDTPACFAEPSFAGISAAAPGGSCGEIGLSWAPAVSNCAGGGVTYSVYRSTSPGTPPSPATLAYEGLTTTVLNDVGLEPGVSYYYIVRADDEMGPEDSNLAELAAVSPALPDSVPPIFPGLATASPGAGCGEVVLGWQPAIESCNGPALFEVHRSTDLEFTPGPETLVGVTFATSFVDTSATPGVAHAYVVRARDEAGNVNANDVHLTVDPGALDQQLAFRNFEASNAGWSAVAPNDATAGNWQWGNPQGTSYQPENDASPPPGVNCWITGLGTSPSNGDIDGGTTTLLSEAFNLASAVAPVVTYQRWFTNDQGGSPGDATDTLRVEVSNDNGSSWSLLEEVGSGTPLAWVPVSHPLPVAPTSQVRLRFSAADLGEGSAVEAGVDELRWIDPGQGCDVCLFPPAQSLCQITVGRSGDDVIVDWSTNPVGSRAVVYHVTGCGLADRIKLGSTLGSSFVHEDAALSDEPFNYRVTFLNACGVELPFCGDTDCP
jgi:hypothetical protein